MSTIRDLKKKRRELQTQIDSINKVLVLMGSRDGQAKSTKRTTPPAPQE